MRYICTDLPYKSQGVKCERQEILPGKSGENEPSQNQMQDTEGRQQPLKASLSKGSTPTRIQSDPKKRETSVRKIKRVLPPTPNITKHSSTKKKVEGSSGQGLAGQSKLEKKQPRSIQAPVKKQLSDTPPSTGVRQQMDSVHGPPSTGGHQQHTPPSTGGHQQSDSIHAPPFTGGHPSTGGHQQSDSVHSPPSTGGHQQSDSVHAPSSTGGHQQSDSVHAPPSTGGHQQPDSIHAPPSTGGHEKPRPGK